MPDYVPANDNALLAFTTNMSSLLTATPVAFGVTAAQATSLSTLLASFSTKLSAAQTPATRGPASILAKDDSRTLLVAEIRALARQINGTQTVTNEQRQQLGLTLRHVRQSIPRPGSSPVMEIVSVTGPRVLIKVHDSTSPRRGRPVGVAGCSVFSHVGPQPPVDITDWVFQGNTGKVKFEIAFDPSLAPGTTVWACCFWYNAKGESGPACQPQSTAIGAAGVSTLSA